jgi:hypothetical protein
MDFMSSSSDTSDPLPAAQNFTVIKGGATAGCNDPPDHCCHL